MNQDNHTHITMKLSRRQKRQLKADKQRRDIITVMSSVPRSKSSVKADGRSFRKWSVNQQFCSGSSLNDPPFHTGPTWVRKGL